PVTPSKVVCVGKNYYAHAMEMQSAPPDEPLLFLKPSTAVVGPEDKIFYPPDSVRVDYEAELGVVISRRCRDVPAERFSDAVLGYTCVNDVTARDLQAKDGQWTRAKGYDTFCPVGPWIETELDPFSVQVESRLNGKVCQSESTSAMMHDAAKLIAYISRVMTLLPGDVIATGTPAGIGPMQVGDTVEVEVEGIGVLRNRVHRP
ncbi:MAG TPA: fumarylacetoacetate hydrolase family protein, partial [Feifaniaceae bacterium]|nr:fumarylacetoacetate hydrolase family protein [Feifaniaceae bacterium]